MTKYLLLLSLCISSVIVPIAVAEEDCVAAVDAADSMNVNQKPCDYRDKGLNGLLHRTFANQSKANAEVVEDTAVSVADLKSPTFLLSGQSDQWANVQLTKMQLLTRASALCDKGFRVIAEEYRPLKMGRIETSLQCICL